MHSRLSKASDILPHTIYDQECLVHYMHAFENKKERGVVKENAPESISRYENGCSLYSLAYGAYLCLIYSELLAIRWIFRSRFRVSTYKSECQACRNAHRLLWNSFARWSARIYRKPNCSGGIECGHLRIGKITNIVTCKYVIWIMTFVYRKGQ